MVSSSRYHDSTCSFIYARLYIKNFAWPDPISDIFTERLWRSLKYEEVYLKDYRGVPEAEEGIGQYFNLYNQERLHQALNYRTPAEVYFQRAVLL
jgi:transposase InsO family protein